MICMYLCVHIFRLQNLQSSNMHEAHIEKLQAKQ